MGEGIAEARGGNGALVVLLTAAYGKHIGGGHLSFCMNVSGPCIILKDSKKIPPGRDSHL